MEQQVVGHGNRATGNQAVKATRAKTTETKLKSKAEFIQSQFK